MSPSQSPPLPLWLYTGLVAFHLRQAPETATGLTTRLKYEGCGGCPKAAVAFAVLKRQGGKACRHLLDFQPVNLDSRLASHLIS